MRRGTFQHMLEVGIFSWLLASAPRWRNYSSPLIDLLFLLSKKSRNQSFGQLIKLSTGAVTEAVGLLTSKAASPHTVQKVLQDTKIRETAVRSGSPSKRPSVRGWCISPSSPCLMLTLLFWGGDAHINALWRGWLMGMTSGTNELAHFESSTKRVRACH